MFRFGSGSKTTLVRLNLISQHVKKHKVKVRYLTQLKNKQCEDPSFTSSTTWLRLLSLYSHFFYTLYWIFFISVKYFIPHATRRFVAWETLPSQPSIRTSWIINRLVHTAFLRSHVSWCRDRSSCNCVFSVFVWESDPLTSRVTPYGSDLVITWRSLDDSLMGCGWESQALPGDR